MRVRTRCWAFSSASVASCAVTASTTSMTRPRSACRLSRRLARLVAASSACRTSTAGRWHGGTQGRSQRNDVQARSGVHVRAAAFKRARSCVQAHLC